MPPTLNDTELRSQVLSAYFDTARYLKSADICVNPGDHGKVVSSRGIFSIPESCYIQSTGHFNSVEFNICYNQIMYDTIAHASKYGLTSYFSAWGVEGFFLRQLPDILITRFHSRFSRPIEPTQFHGEFSILSARLHRACKSFLYLKTDCRFFDNANGEAIGEVDLAITNP
ncbi:FcoT family thioesterase [Burkholderia sp. TSV86]|uniref:FcoT family thioesterase n=1 Tax=Burkholderia sp. TSV86 TaxID=1385594 RepID=UPI0007570C7C|nr:FcoT family thioesterase [Burkholderia sp. TSV86]KVE32646.1 hypothetical protein WS68_16075 [Burkholderia sp. TSV86]